MTGPERQIWPAAERNKEPILNVLRRLVSPGATVLEVASGSGQHAAHFAAQLDLASYQPTDMDLGHHPSIAAWTRDLPAVLPVQQLDVTRDPWPIGDVRFDVIYCANMIHIAPFEACLGLLRGAAGYLNSGGLLCLYGPFMVDGQHTAPSNAEFDLSLRQRDPRWGVRDLTVVTRRAQERGLEYCEKVEMPANNLLVVFRY
ncbi:MAG: DUF938 domain-containing protein [Myxococcales bacterium]|nr:DUF938 domain-containing protein [Myxococcales bacterium]